MIKKILSILLFAFLIMPALVNKANAQGYGGETMEIVRDDGSVEHYYWDVTHFEYDWWTLDHTDPAPGTTTSENPQPDPDPSDPTNPDDPTYDPFYDFNDYEDFLEWLDNILDEPPTGSLGNPPNEKPAYYITSSSDNGKTKYYSGSQIVVIGATGSKVSLTFHKVNDPNMASNQIKWDKDGVIDCLGFQTCTYNTVTTGTYTVKVYKNATTNELVNVKLIVSDKSIVKFHQKDNFDGEYGFDEDGHNYPRVKNVSNYQTLTIGDINYNVPWMSLLHGQAEVEVKLEPLITDANANDPSFWVEFRPTNSKIKINGSIMPLHLNGRELKATQSIQVKADEFDAEMNNHSQEAIEAITNSNKVIGKIMISCQKAQERRVVLVYVNTGTGYRDQFTTKAQIKKDLVLSRLNTNSHNQIFKKWIALTDYPETLDLATEYASNPASINFLNDTDPSSISVSLANYYKNKTGVNWVTLNNGKKYQDRTFFHFITDLPSLKWGGVVNSVGNVLGCTFRDKNLEGIGYKTIIHELGHNLNLAHIFESSTNPFAPDISKFSTDNFMDYSAIRNMFFYYQWSKSY